MRGQRPDLSVADTNWLGDVDSLQAQAEALARAHDGSDSYRGTESSGSVWVTVDRTARLVDVRISQNWPDRLPADQFTDALFSAYTTAAQTAMVVESSKPDTSAPASSPIEEIPFGLSEDEWANRVAAQLAETERDLAAIRRADIAEWPADEEVRGRNGYLTLALRNGGPVAITADPAVLAYADADRLRQDVLDVFAQAGLGVLPEEEEDRDGDFGFEY